MPIYDHEFPKSEKNYGYANFRQPGNKQQQKCASKTEKQAGSSRCQPATKKKQKSEDDSRRVNAPDRLYVLSIYRHMTEAAKSMSVDKTIELSSW